MYYGDFGASQVALVVKNLPVNAGDVRDMSLIPGLGRSLDQEMATHFSILAWTIPWIEELGRLQSIGSQSWTRLSTHIHDDFITHQLCQLEQAI